MKLVADLEGVFGSPERFLRGFTAWMGPGN
jgi:hypothetical protein